MGLQVSVTNRGTESVHLTAHKRDGQGRFTTAYQTHIPAGQTKILSTETGDTFMVSEEKAAHGVLLPRGVAPAVEAKGAQAIAPAAEPVPQTASEG